MPYFAEPDLKTLALPSNKDYWVKVVSELRYGDIKKFAVSGEDAAASADIYLQTVIKEWNLDDESGTVLPINAENVDKLSQDDAIFIINTTGGMVNDVHSKKN